ncbi:hypothetical protein KP05_16760 [Cobetia amphilecti]|uniref:hypothetical protein n=1 Tax=Cobetia amphilecti TaxID=1055104 RepID=UPI0005070389|nr:hypothetical protein [Cobetia amphilecti]KGA00864.1 hypothetical protein KP05_16760 [Cobetia amphilecti]
MRQVSQSTWQPPAHSPCPQCDGSGTFHGVFHCSPCAHCHGTGYATEDGEALPLEDLIVMISQRRDHWRRKYRLMMQVPGVRQAVEQYQAARQAEQEREAMGYGQGRYQGD